jgi:acetolactate synthase I/II/III large subunit
MLVAKYIVEHLKETGTDVIFGVGGANIEDVYDAIFHHGTGIKAVIAKHEFSAVTMADGYSRSSGKLGVVVATSGGGAFNLIPGITEAATSSVALLAIVGQIPQHLEGKGGFQDSSGMSGSLSAESIFRGASKSCQRITCAAQVPKALQDAMEIALTPPFGPSVLLIPKNIQASLMNFSTITSLCDSDPAEKSAISIENFQRAVKLICNATPDVHIICGDAVLRKKVKSLVDEIASRLDATVSVTATGKGAFDNHSPRFVGAVGVMGHLSAYEAIQQAKTCILIGTRMSAMSRFGLEDILAKKNVVHIHHDATFLNVHDAEFIELIGSIPSILNALLLEIKSHGLAPNDLNGVVQPEFKFLQAPATEASTAFQAWMTILDGQMESTANIIIDAGNTGAAAVHFLKAPSHGTWTIALGMGGMGYSFGAAIGACLANGNKTYVVAGDGAFFMHGSEIHTAIELNLPIIFIVFNNNAHAMCVMRETLFYTAPYSYNRFKQANIGDGIKAMFPTIPVYTVTTTVEFEKALGRLSGHASTSLICVEMDADEMPPFKPFLDKLETLAVS